MVEKGYSFCGCGSNDAGAGTGTSAGNTELSAGATMTKNITIKESVFQENGFTDITAMDASFVIYKIENMADSEITDAVNVEFQAVEE